MRSYMSPESFLPVEHPATLTTLENLRVIDDSMDGEMVVQMYFLLESFVTHVAPELTLARVNQNMTPHRCLGGKSFSADIAREGFLLQMFLRVIM